jgi:preprotein translocase subunit SecG
MILFLISLIDLFKKFWLLLCCLLIFLILIRKADEDSLYSSKFPFLNGSKKSEKFVDIFIWCSIFLYFTLGIVFSIKNFY